MTEALQWEKRNELLAGILTATTVLVVGYASGFGHLLGAIAPSVPFAASAPGALPPGPASGKPAPAADRATGNANDYGTDHAMTVEPSPVPPRVEGGATHPSTASTCDPALESAIAEPFWTHLQRGHLDESPGQQVNDILDTDQYVTTHTVLLEDMLAPVYAATSHVTDAASTFWMHVKHGHLEESPGEQANDILDPGQYVTTHTVLLEDLLTPASESAAGTC